MIDPILEARVPEVGCKSASAAKQLTIIGTSWSDRKRNHDDPSHAQRRKPCLTLNGVWTMVREETKS
jgi:hypothetical protein